MNFKKFLIEKFDTINNKTEPKSTDDELNTKIKNKYILIYHKLLSALDKAHIDTSNEQYSFNLGSVIKDSRFRKLTVIITSDSKLKNKVRLGQKDNEFFLYIYLNKLPTRLNIDKILSHNQNILDEFCIEIQNYIENYMDQSNIQLSSHEEEERLIDNNNVEQKYDDLIKKINDLKNEYTNALAELDHTTTFNVNAIKKSSIQLAKDKLKDDYFGKSQKEFIKKMLALPEGKFISLLDKARQKIFISRLENFYDQFFNK